MRWWNRAAARVMTAIGVTAATGGTGYGWIGHRHERCSGSKVGAEVHVDAVPLLAATRDYLARGFRPAGTIRNAETFRSRVHLRGVDDSEFTLMCDAQTSGGLLMSVPQDKLGAIEKRFREGGLFYANVGRVTDRPGTVTLMH